MVELYVLRNSILTSAFSLASTYLYKRSVPNVLSTLLNIPYVKDSFTAILDSNAIKALLNMPANSGFLIYCKKEPNK